MYIRSFCKKEEFKKLKIKMDSESKSKLNKIQKTSNRVELERITGRTSKEISVSDKNIKNIRRKRHGKMLGKS